MRLESSVRISIAHGYGNSEGCPLVNVLGGVSNGNYDSNLGENHWVEYLVQIVG